MKPTFQILVPLLLLLVSCDSNKEETSASNRNYKQDMRDFVIGISTTAKAAKPGFLVIPQNGIELVSDSGDESGNADSTYLSAIDANGQEDLFYGYENDDQPTPSVTSTYLRHFLDLSRSAGKTILVTDYCSTPSKMENSYLVNAGANYISFAAPQRGLNVIPDSAPNNINSNNILSLSEAKNFLYLIDPENFTTKANFIAAVTATNYDLVIMDLFLENESFTAAEIAQLRHKANGGSRLVICYMSIGEAENYRYYWNTAWNSHAPTWLAAENPDWPGNFKVRYWDSEWQGIIYGNSDSYLSKVTAAGFDGVYLDIIDAFEYFENNE